jgi:uncharacterized membrane protein
MSSETDIKMDIAIGNLLRIGVSVAAAVVLTGWILYLAHAHGAIPDYRHFHGQPILITHLFPILRGAAALDPRGIIELGILLLIATPVARVLFCVVSFSLQKDKLYTLVSSVVLAVLLYSLFFRT